MKLVCPSVLSPVRTGSCLVLTLLLALQLAPRAPAATCTENSYDCGDRWEFSCLLSFLGMFAENSCKLAPRIGVRPAIVSAQQWLDGLPACLGREDGGAYYFPPIGTDTIDLAKLSTNLLAMWGGVYSPTQYVTRQIEQVHSFLGDGPLLPDTDRYQFPGTAGTNVVIRLSEEIALRSPLILRHGDAILTLTAPDGTSVVRRVRSLLPVELRATLPADGTYTLAVSQRAGSERSFAGNYRLTFKHTAGSVTTNAQGEVESCLFRSPIDPELDQPPPAGLPPPAYPLQAGSFGQCPGTDGSQMGKCIKSMTATVSVPLCPSLFTLGTPYLHTCSGSNWSTRIYGKVLKITAGRETLTVIFPLETNSLGNALGVSVDYFGDVVPGLAITDFFP